MIGTSCEDLRLTIEKTSWKNQDGTELSAVSFGHRLNRVFLTLTHYIFDKSASKISTVLLQSTALVFVREDSAAPSRGSIQQTEASPIPAPARLRASKRPANDVPQASTLKKKPRKTGKAGSLGSGLTQTEETKKAKAKDKDVPDYQKFTEIQKAFWDDCEFAYVFDMNTTFPVNVKQCHIAKDEYIVRDLERDIVKSVKEELVRMGDINQRQKVYLTPVTNKLKLMPEKPKSWGDIKDGKFMIIIGQHSIVASQELQVSGFRLRVSIICVTILITRNLHGILTYLVRGISGLAKINLQI